MLDRRMPCWLIVLVLCWMALAPAGAVAADPAPAAAPAVPAAWQTDAVFDNLSRAHGLPGAMVLSVAEDDRGFKWMGTDAGLARWDGYRFQVYKPDPHTPGALPDGFVTHVLRGAHGTLWLGTNTAGLLRFDPATERFERFPVGTPNGLSHATVRTLADDGAGGIWIGTSGGLNHLEVASGKITQVSLTSPPAAESPKGSAAKSLTITSLVVDGDVLWVGGSAGLFRRASATSSFEKVVLPSKGDERQRPMSLMLDSRHRLWVGSNRGAAYIIDSRVGMTPQALSDMPGADRTELQGLSGIIKMTEVQAGEVWLGTYKGVFAVNLDGVLLRKIQRIENWPFSIPDNPIYWIHADKAGQVWVGTPSGVGRFNTQQKAISTRFGVDAATSKRASAYLDCVVWMPDGTIWLGTQRGSIEVLDESGAHLLSIEPDNAHPETALPQEPLVVMRRMPNGEVLAGGAQGLYRVRLKGLSATVERVAISGRDRTNGSTALLVDGDTLWMGGFDGLWRQDLRTGAYQRMLRDPRSC